MMNKTVLDDKIQQYIVDGLAKSYDSLYTEYYEIKYEMTPEGRDRIIHKANQTKAEIKELIERKVLCEIQQTRLEKYLAGIQFLVARCHAFHDTGEEDYSGAQVVCFPKKHG